MHRLFRDLFGFDSSLVLPTNDWKLILEPEISNTTLTQSHLESLRHIDFQGVSSLTVPLVVN